MKQCHRCSNNGIEADVLFCPACGTAVFTETILDKKYRLDALIGEGGMGQVYRATHTKIGKNFAIKILPPAVVAAEQAAVERFLNEARLLASVNHENVIAITDFGASEGSSLVYLVMEYLEGKTLKTFIQESSRLDYRDSLWIFERVCNAMSAVHAKGIVHRDLKPQNIFLTTNERGDASVKALDFGIALKDNKRYTKTGQLIGSVEYMSPEHCNDKELDVRSDIYTLGVDLYEMLAGRVPFQESDKGPTEILYQQMFQQPRPLRDFRSDIPSSIEKVVLKALEKNPEDRQQSALELAREFKEALITAGIKPMGADEQIAINFSDTVKALPKIDRLMDAVPDAERKYEGDMAATSVRSLAQETVKAASIKNPSEYETKPIKDPSQEKTVRIKTQSTDESQKLKSALDSASGIEETVSNSAPKRSFSAPTAVVILACVSGVSGWLYVGRNSSEIPTATPPAAASPAALKETRTHTVSYWGELRQYRNNMQIGEATRLTGGIAGETYFSAGDGLKFFVKSSDAGYFYLINEESNREGLPPKYNIIFPSPEANDGASKVGANIQAATSECLFDEKAGTEKVWIVWSANPVAELDEAARRWTNKADEGFIKDARQAEAVSKFLNRHGAAKLQIESDEANERINLIDKDDLIVYPLRLKHR